MTDTNRYRTIIVGTDGSTLAKVVIDRAARLAALEQADLVIVCAWSGLDLSTEAHGPESVAGTGVVTALPSRSAASKALSEATSMATSLGATVSASVLIDGDPAAALLNSATEREAQLIVMGAISRPGLVERLLGDVASEVVRKAVCDVLIVRPREDTPA